MKKILYLFLFSEFIFSSVLSPLTINTTIEKKQSTEIRSDYIDYQFNNNVLLELIKNNNNIDIIKSKPSFSFSYNTISNLENSYKNFKKNTINVWKGQDFLGNYVKPKIKPNNINSKVELYKKVKVVNNQLFRDDMLNNIDDYLSNMSKGGMFYQECRKKRNRGMDVSSANGISETIEQLKEDIFAFEKDSKAQIEKLLLNAYSGMYSLISDEAIAEYSINTIMMSTSYLTCKAALATGNGASIIIDPVGAAVEGVSKILLTKQNNKKVKTKQQKTNKGLGGGTAGTISVGIPADFKYTISLDTKQKEEWEKIKDKKAKDEYLQNQLFDQCYNNVYEILIKSISELFDILNKKIEIETTAITRCTNEKLKQKNTSIQSRLGSNAWDKNAALGVKDQNIITSMFDSTFDMFNTFLDISVKNPMNLLNNLVEATKYTKQIGPIEQELEKRKKKRKEIEKSVIKNQIQLIQDYLYREKNDKFFSPSEKEEQKEMLDIINENINEDLLKMLYSTKDCEKYEINRILKYKLLLYMMKYEVLKSIEDLEKQEKVYNESISKSLLPNSIKSILKKSKTSYKLNSIYFKIVDELKSKYKTIDNTTYAKINLLKQKAKLSGMSDKYVKLRLSKIQPFVNELIEEIDLCYTQLPNNKDDVFKTFVGVGDYYDSLTSLSKLKKYYQFDSNGLSTRCILYKYKNSYDLKYNSYKLHDKKIFTTKDPTINENFVQANNKKINEIIINLKKKLKIYSYMSKLLSGDINYKYDSSLDFINQYKDVLFLENKRSNFINPNNSCFNYINYLEVESLSEIFRKYIN